MSGAGGRHSEVVAALRRAVLDGPGALSPADRRGIAEGDPPPDLAAFVEKVRHDAHLVTDAEVESLVAAGRSEDELFEATVSAAVGAGLRRLEAGLEALR